MCPPPDPRAGLAGPVVAPSLGAPSGHRAWRPVAGVGAVRWRDGGGGGGLGSARLSSWRVQPGGRPASSFLKKGGVRAQSVRVCSSDTESEDLGFQEIDLGGARRPFWKCEMGGLSLDILLEVGAAWEGPAQDQPLPWWSVWSRALGLCT